MPLILHSNSLARKVLMMFHAEDLYRANPTGPYKDNWVRAEDAVIDENARRAAPYVHQVGPRRNIPSIWG